MDYSLNNALSRTSDFFDDKYIIWNYKIITGNSYVVIKYPGYRPFFSDQSLIAFIGIQVDRERSPVYDKRTVIDSIFIVGYDLGTRIVTGNRSHTIKMTWLEAPVTSGGTAPYQHDRIRNRLKKLSAGTDIVFVEGSRDEILKTAMLIDPAARSHFKRSVKYYLRRKKAIDALWYILIAIFGLYAIYMVLNE